MRILSLVTCVGVPGGVPGEDDVHVPVAAPQQPPRLLHAHTPQTRPGNIHKLVALLEPPVSATVYYSFFAYFLPILHFFFGFPFLFRVSELLLHSFLITGGWDNFSAALKLR